MADTDMKLDEAEIWLNDTIRILNETQTLLDRVATVCDKAPQEEDTILGWIDETGNTIHQHVSNLSEGFKGLCDTIGGILNDSFNSLQNRNTAIKSYKQNIE